MPLRLAASQHGPAARTAAAGVAGPPLPALQQPTSPPPTSPPALSAASLLSLSAVQRQAAALLAHIQDGNSAHFVWDGAAHEALHAHIAQALQAHIAQAPTAHRAPAQQAPAAQTLPSQTGRPGVPLHLPPWPRYASGGVDRWGELAWAEGLAPGPLADHHREERARTRIDLLLVTALIGCEAAPGWAYHDRASGQTLHGADALAVATLRLFASGACSDQPHHPLRADAAALAALTPQQLAAAFPPHQGRPLPGLARRTARLRRLGQVALDHAERFAAPEDPRHVRLGHLLDACLEQAGDGPLQADDLLALLLPPLNDLAPGRLAQDGRPLGDCWAHPQAAGGLVPLHALAQWLALGLLEPLRDAGLAVQGLGVLPAAAGWRLGGWLLDTGVLRPRQPQLLAQALPLEAAAVVEWRAATCAVFRAAGANAGRRGGPGHPLRRPARNPT